MSTSPPPPGESGTFGLREGTSSPPAGSQSCRRRHRVHLEHGVSMAASHSIWSTRPTAGGVDRIGSGRPRLTARYA